MTDKYIEISKEAMKYLGNETQRLGKLWLVLDNGACAELAAEYRIDILQKNNRASAGVYSDNGYKPYIGAMLADHNNDRMLATNYAILSTVIEINKARGLG